MFNTISHKFVFACLVALLPQLAAGTEAIVGSGGGVEIGSDDVKKLVAGLPEATRKALRNNSAPLVQAVRGEIVRRVLLAESAREHFDKDPAVVADLERLRDEVVVRQWVAHHSLVPKEYPSDGDVEANYKALSARLATSDDYRLGQIFVAMPEGLDSAGLKAALSKLAEVQAKLGSGATFADLAKRYSDHQESAAKGGDLEFENEMRLLPEIRAAVKNLNTDDKPVLVKSTQGFHIIRLIAKKSATVPSLSEVKESLTAELRRARANELEKRFVSDVSTRAAPAINEVEINRIVKEVAP
jgi:hypothetical protein